SRRYVPSLGVSSKPRIESSVVLPQPDGPLMATYSPSRISRCTSASAWVSTSSVKKILRIPCSRIRAVPFFAMLSPLFQFYPLHVVIARHIRQHHGVAFGQAVDDLDRVDRRPSQLHRNAHGIAAVFDELEHPDRRVRLSVSGSSRVQHVVQPFDRDRRINA